MTNARILFAATMLFAVFSTGAEAKLYKWVDEKGETHYGEVIPPEYAGQSRVQFDEKGREVKPEEQKAGPGKDNAVEDQAAIDQKRRDAALLGSYSSEQEIDLARDRNLQQINAVMDGTRLRLKTAQGDLDGYQKEKDARLKQGKPMDKDLQDDIDRAGARVGRLKNDLAKSQVEADAIRARYDADKQRFRELKSGGKR
jgi:hypothetical protein